MEGVYVWICLKSGMYSICIRPLCKHLSVRIHLSSCPSSNLTPRTKEKLSAALKRGRTYICGLFMVLNMQYAKSGHIQEIYRCD